MREYINVYQLDELDSNNIRLDDYILVSQDALSYKFGIGSLSEIIIDNIDTSSPIFNANKLFGYALEFTEPVSNHQLITFDEISNSWVNKELDIDSVFRFEEFEPTKFIRLDNEKNVITSDVYVSDLVVDTPDKADHVLMVADNGSDVIYVDIFGYIENAIDTKSNTFIPLLNAEINRATNEEIRLETLINNEIDRATNEEIRIENKFDTLVNSEISRIETDFNTIGDSLRKDLDDEILRAIDEENRIETLLTNGIEVEKDRAIDEERRLEALIIAGLQGASNDLDSFADNLLDALQAEINRATSEEVRIEGLINNEIARASSEESRIEGIANSASNSASSAQSTANLALSSIPNVINSVTSTSTTDAGSANAVRMAYNRADELWKYFQNEWGFTYTPYADDAGHGYFKFPSGLIIQFGRGNTGTNGYRTVFLPIRYPQGRVSIIASESAGSGWNSGGTWNPTIYATQHNQSDMQAGRFTVYGSRVFNNGGSDIAPFIQFDWISIGF